jgi:hypothetical protein
MLHEDEAARAVPHGDLSALTEDFQRLQLQKARRFGGVEARVLINLAFFYGEHEIAQSALGLVQPAPTDPNKLHLVFNLAKHHCRRKLGRLASVAPRFGASPNTQDPRAVAQAEVVDKLILALDAKLDQPMRTWEILFWILMGGVAVEHVPWVPNASTEPMPKIDPGTGQILWLDNQTNESLIDAAVEALIVEGRPPESFSIQEELREIGDVGSTVYGPLNVFVDASVRDLRSLAPDQRVYIAEAKTLGWISSVFGSDAAAQAKGGALSIIKTSLHGHGPTLGGTNIKDLIPGIQGAKGSRDPDMAVVVTGYEPPSETHPHGREIFFVPNQVILDDRPMPFEEIPLVDYHFEPAATSFWSPDFMSDLIPPNKFLNKRMSQLGEQANASIYDLLLLGPTLAREDIPTDTPGLVKDGITEDGKLMLARLPGPSLPGWFMDSIKLVVQFLSTLGSADLLSHPNFPGQLRGPLAVPMLQEILDSEDGPLFQHLGERFARVKQMRINRVKQFYPPVRTLNFAGKGLRDEVLIFHTAQILRAGTEFSVTVDRHSLVPELSALREARVRERLNSPLSILYIDPRTGRLDPSKIASDLQGHDLERESKEAQGRTLARQVVEHLWRSDPVAPPLPFYPHSVFMDEIEAAMLSSEFQSASAATRNAFFTQWNLHREFLQQAADRVANEAEQTQIRQAVAQASAQVAAQTAAITVEDSLEQIQASGRAAAGPPSMEDRIERLLAGGTATATAGGGPGPTESPQVPQVPNTPPFR